MPCELVDPGHRSTAGNCRGEAAILWASRGEVILERVVIDVLIPTTPGRDLITTAVAAAKADA